MTIFRSTEANTENFKQGGWSTKELVVAGVLSLGFGIIFIVWDQLYNLARIGLVALAVILGGLSAEKLPLYHLLMGVWFGAGVFVPYIVRRRGASVLAECIAAMVEMSVSPRGIFILGNGLVQGLASEAVFAAFGYKRYNWYVLCLAGALPGLTSFLYERFYSPVYQGIDLKIFIWSVFFRMISGVFLGGLLSKYFADELAKTGALAQFFIGKKYIKEI